MKCKNVFVTHHKKDHEEVKVLKKILPTKEGYQVKTSPVDKIPHPIPSSLKKILIKQIEQAKTVAILISPQSSQQNEKIDWIVAEANRQGKNIVGIFTPRAEIDDVPESLKMYGDALVEWDAVKIKEAIEDQCHDWENPDGSPWENDHEVTRSTC